MCHRSFFLGEIRIKDFLAARKCQVKPQASSWFFPGSSFAITPRNHLFWLYQHDSSDHSQHHFLSARNKRKRISNEAKSPYAERMRCKTDLIKSKFSILPLYFSLNIVMVNRDKLHEHLCSKHMRIISTRFFFPRVESLLSEMHIYQCIFFCYLFQNRSPKSTRAWRYPFNSHKIMWFWNSCFFLFVFFSLQTLQ